MQGESVRDRAGALSLLFVLTIVGCRERHRGTQEDLERAQHHRRKTDTTPDPEPPPPPPKVTISVVSALVALRKKDGNAWDIGGGRIPSGVVEQLAAANTYVAAAAVLASPLVRPIAKPDPFGVASLETGNGSPVDRDLPKIQDTFTPQWRTARWTGVRLDSTVRITVTLTDKDIELDDPIGTARVGSRTLRRALDDEGVYAVKVDDPTSQILWLGITVRPENDD